MDKAQVVFDGTLDGTSNADELEQLGTAVMETLIELDAQDPFVSADGTDMAVRISFTVNAIPGPESLAVGAELLQRALEQLGVPYGLGMEASTNALSPA